MDFASLSDEELEKIASGGSDYSSMSDEELERIANPPSKIESGLRGLAQGASMGFADEITGAAESLFTDKPYSQARDESRANYASAKSANPGIYTTGEVGGGIGTAFIPGLNIAKGAGLAKAALQSAALGGLTGAGYSEADDALGVAKDAGIGATIGGGLGAGAHKVVPYAERAIQKIGAGAGDMAERFAARALGAERGTIKSLGIDKVKAAGRQALDEGVLSPLANTDDLITRNEALKSKGGQMMGQAYDAIDAAGASTFNPLEAASKVDEKIGGFYRSPINRGETNQLENTLESILMRGEKSIPIREAQILKEELGSVANWRNTLNITDKEKMARDAYRVVSEQIDNAVADGAGAIDKAGLSDILKKGKDLYSKASSAEALLKNKQAREEGNKLLGITDWSVIGGGALGAAFTGGASIPAALAITAGKKGLEKYGAQNAALGLNKVSQALMKSPKLAAIYEKSPQTFNALAQKLEGQMSGGIGKAADAEKPKPYDKNAILEKTNGTKFQQVLQNATQRGDQAFGATHFVLQNTDPEYRRAIGIGDEEQ